MKKTIFLIAISFVFFACGGSEKQADTSSESTTQTETPAASPAEETSSEAVIDLEGDDTMKFNKKEIRVKAGQTVKLTLKHTGQLPKEAMGHNFVLLAQGVDIAEFGASAMTASATGYIPEGSESSVIAHTDLVGGGESTTVEFEAPSAGTYDFICSFPGHYALMQGKFIVE